MLMGSRTNLKDIRGLALVPGPDTKWKSFSFYIYNVGCAGSLVT